MTPRRQLLPVLALGLAIAIATSIVLVLSSAGSAANAPSIVPLTIADVNPALRRGLEDEAGRSGVDRASIVEIGGHGDGDRRQAVFAGIDGRGRTQVSFSHGFGLTFFTPSDRVFQPGKSIAFAQGASGTSTVNTAVGVVGAVNARVDRVVVQLASGDQRDLELVGLADGRADIRFFAWLGESPDSFPTGLSAYDTAGALIDDYALDTQPLCPEDNADCVEG